MDIEFWIILWGLAILGFVFGTISFWFSAEHLANRLDALLDYLGLEIKDREEEPKYRIVKKRKQER